MKCIEAYKTEDGSVFEDKAKAERHETVSELRAYFDMNPIFGGTMGV